MQWFQTHEISWYVTELFDSLTKKSSRSSSIRRAKRSASQSFWGQRGVTRTKERSAKSITLDKTCHEWWGKHICTKIIPEMLKSIKLSSHEDPALSFQAMGSKTSNKNNGCFYLLLQQTSPRDDKCTPRRRHQTPREGEPTWLEEHGLDSSTGLLGCCSSLECI